MSLVNIKKMLIHYFNFINDRIFFWLSIFPLTTKTLCFRPPMIAESLLETNVSVGKQ